MNNLLIAGLFFFLGGEFFYDTQRQVENLVGGSDGVWQSRDERASTSFRWHSNVAFLTIPTPYLPHPLPHFEVTVPLFEGSKTHDFTPGGRREQALERKESGEVATNKWRLKQTKDATAFCLLSVSGVQARTEFSLDRKEKIVLARFLSRLARNVSA